MSNFLGNLMTAAFLAVLSVSPKIWLQRHPAQVDTDRLNLDIVHRLTATAFHAGIDYSLSVPAVRASRADCDVLARNGDRVRELHDIFRLEGSRYRTLTVGYRGKWTAHPPDVRALLERFAQNGATRVGFHFERPAVIALSELGGCPGVREALNGITAHASLKRFIGDDFDEPDPDR